MWKKYMIALTLFVLPSVLSRFIFNMIKVKSIHISKGVRIGFSILIADEIQIGEFSKIGSVNILQVKSLVLGKNTYIGNRNRIKGNMDVCLNRDAVISRKNNITNNLKFYRKTKFSLGQNTVIGSAHHIDTTQSVSIGDNSILAGIGTQLWTHGFYHSRKGASRWRIDHSIHIGNNVYIGSRCIICQGVSIGDAITVGAGSVVSKSITEPGLYVSQSLRFIEFNADERVKQFKEESKGIINLDITT